MGRDQRAACFGIVGPKQATCCQSGIRRGPSQTVVRIAAPDDEGRRSVSDSSSCFAWPGLRSRRGPACPCPVLRSGRRTTSFLIISARKGPLRRYSLDSTGPYQSLSRSRAPCSHRVCSSRWRCSGWPRPGRPPHPPRTRSRTRRPPERVKGQIPKDEGRGGPPGRPGGRGPAACRRCRSRGRPSCPSCRPCPPSTTPRSTPRPTSPTARSCRRPTRTTPAKRSGCTSTCRRATRPTATPGIPCST